jgi:predicted phosphodiesterase
MRLVEKLGRWRKRTARADATLLPVTAESEAQEEGERAYTAMETEVLGSPATERSIPMRCLVISDIHSNLAALEAVLEDVQHRNITYDTLWCLGDVVGYGPDPNECLALLRAEAHVCLAGNHDWAVLDKLDLETFHENAAYVVRMTRDKLTPENYAYLQACHEELICDAFHLAHASPREPIWEYITDINVAEDNFGFFDEQYCLVGHTHVPVIFVKDPRTKNVRASYPNFGVPIQLKASYRYIINPGSVGQPRDGDARAAYAILDTDVMTWTPYRVEYPYKKTQDRMRTLNIPSRLVDRLEYGR